MRGRFGRTSAGGLSMVTFADLLILLLVFFLLLFSMMRLDETAWRPAGASLAEHFGGGFLPVAARPGAGLSLGGERAPRGADLDYLAALLRGLLSEQPALAGAELRQFEDRVLLSLPTALLFEEASARPRPEAEHPLAALASLFAGIGNAVTVSGEGDPQPSAHEEASNWELSLKRAAALADLLRAGGGRRPLFLTGRLARPLAPARRCEIVIWSAEGPS